MHISKAPTMANHHRRSSLGAGLVRGVIGAVNQLLDLSAAATVDRGGVGGAAFDTSELVIIRGPPGPQKRAGGVQGRFILPFCASVLAKQTLVRLWTPLY